MILQGIKTYIIRMDVHSRMTFLQSDSIDFPRIIDPNTNNFDT